MARLKASEIVALQAIGLAAAAVVAFDFFVHNLGLWPSVIIGAVLAAAFYKAGLEMKAHETTVDRKR